MRLARTRRPTTFTEKVRYKMLLEHCPLLVTFADKAAVRDYIAAVVGEQYLPRAYAMVDDPPALGDLDLPDAYVIKPTHGSGAVVVGSPTPPSDARLPDPAPSWVYRHVRPEQATGSSSSESPSTG